MVAHHVRKHQKKHRRFPDIKMIAVDGAPGSGKSEFIDFIASDPLIEERCWILREVASRAWQMGMPRPDKLEPDKGVTREEMLTDMWAQVQDFIYNSQMDLEYANQSAGYYTGKKLIGIVDSGLPRGGAYYPGGLSALAKAHDTTPEALRTRYGLCVFFDTPALWSDEMYMKHCFNPIKRPELPERARELHYLTLATYDGHPNVVRLSVEEDKIKKFSRAMDAIRKFIGA